MNHLGIIIGHCWDEYGDYCIKGNNIMCQCRLNSNKNRTEEDLCNFHRKDYEKYLKGGI